jgi:hypothetical protein
MEIINIGEQTTSVDRPVHRYKINDNWTSRNGTHNQNSDIQLSVMFPAWFLNKTINKIIKFLECSHEELYIYARFKLIGVDPKTVLTYNINSFIYMGVMFSILKNKLI